MEVISWILFGAFVVLFTFFGTLTIGYKNIENKLARFVAGLLLYPLVGLIFWLLGWIFTFLSKVILMPFNDVF